MKYQINDDICVGCAGCYTFCPVGAPHEGVKPATMRIDIDSCIGCGMCATLCPVSAITPDIN